ncbi:hypothetical protein SAMN02910353_02009, partial [Ruminococcus sp. YRD2003]|uniref:hypothetical protein n=1 Tax=Ruminococcus sp. YRD2003 TaxID=1452313 RepID=UPI0008C13FBF
AANGCTYPLSASLTSPYTVGSHSAFRIADKNVGDGVLDVPQNTASQKISKKFQKKLDKRNRL